MTTSATDETRRILRFAFELALAPCPFDWQERWKEEETTWLCFAVPTADRA